MSIDTIVLENFKCFERCEFALGKLTILSGFNSCGKSSSIQPLLLLHQSLKEDGTIGILRLQGDCVNLGNASDVVRRGSGNRIGIEFLSAGQKHCLEYEYRKSDVRNCLVLSGVNQKEVDETFKSVLDEIIYLSAVRDPFVDVQRFPAENSWLPGNVGASGEFSAYNYIVHSDDDVPASRRHPDFPKVNTFRGQLDVWLKHIFPGAAVNIQRLMDMELGRIQFASGPSQWAHAANVGYGLSYALPILIALLKTPDTATLIVDSPEAHLHPRAQSKMGALLAYFANSGLRLVVETHSDHVLSGVRIAVKNAIIEPEDASIYFFEEGNSGRASSNPGR